MSIFKKKVKVGLALGGGAARGLAHIGVLKVLEQEKIKIDYVAGTSAGSIVGALYCSGYRWKEIKERAGSISWLDLVNPTLSFMGLIKTEKLEKVIAELVGRKCFEDLDIPFRAVAVDVTAGREVILESGPIPPAVRASCSIPGIFEPASLEGKILIDGGVTADVPAEAVRDMGADVVIAVSLNSDRVKAHPPKNLLDVLLYSLNIMMYSNTEKNLKSASCVIAPDLKDFRYTDLNRLEEMIEKGEEAAREKIGEIKRKCGIAG